VIPEAIAGGRARSPFGELLRHHRKLSGMSQLELAVRASTTPRHVSFLETGRSRPGRELVARLVDVLAVPPVDHDRWLMAAGFAPRASAKLAPFP
jgi:transcriptional regulator with XRE-family HTH domain